jgi:heme/copper-type cytochrome/quinol oxidase subunit 2
MPGVVYRTIILRNQMDKTSLALWLSGYIILMILMPLVWFLWQERKRKKELERLNAQYFKRKSPNRI